MIKRISILGVILLILSCGRKKPPIPQSEMVDILMDVHIGEALISGIHSASKDSIEPRYLKQVLEKWELSEAELEAALEHMNGDPTYLQEVLQLTLEKVRDRSEELEDEELEEKRKKRQHTIDTLKNKIKVEKNLTPE